jgi:hypothetical protein
MELLFYRVYEVANLMVDLVNVSGTFDEICWDVPDVERCLTKFSKVSLLNYFCFSNLSQRDRKKARKDPDTFDVDSIEAAFENYSISYKPLNDFLRAEFGAERDESSSWLTGIEQDALFPWMDEQDEAFSGLWSKVADEVVHVLFSNRSFLLNFNTELAEFRKERGDKASPRCSIPQWVKKAAYFRENGRCALCKKDLSGLVAIDPKQHYDHMVPLKRLGANHSCNMQLLCGPCNQEKAASEGRTSSDYQPWWED